MRYVLVCLFACGESSSKTSEAPASSEPPPPSARSAPSPRAAPEPVWETPKARSLHQGSSLLLGEGRRLEVTLAWSVADGAHELALGLKGVHFAKGSAIAIAGGKARAVFDGHRFAPHQIPVPPSSAGLADLALADVLDRDRPVEVPVELEITLPGHAPVRTRVPPLSAFAVGRALFTRGPTSTSSTSGIAFAGEASSGEGAEKQRDTLMYAELSQLIAIGDGKTLGDVDLVAHGHSEAVGKASCPGFTVAFQRRPTAVVVHDRRTGAEVARRTFEGKCPRQQAWTVGGVANLVPSRDEVHGWLKTLVPAASTSAGTEARPRVRRE
jgi:hypothetical protein